MIYTLELVCWKGSSLGATHWYVHLRDLKYNSYGNEYAHSGLTRKLSKREAESINSKMRAQHSDDYYRLFKVKAGEQDWRFNSKEDAIACGISEFNKIAKEGDTLVDYDKRNIIYAMK
jgi:RNA binding exosome subunit